MADITITIPSAQLNRVANAVAARNGYNATTDGTKAAFVKKQIHRWLISETVAYEAEAAAEAATAAAKADVVANVLMS